MYTSDTVQRACETVQQYLEEERGGGESKLQERSPNVSEGGHVIDPCRTERKDKGLCVNTGKTARGVPLRRGRHRGGDVRFGRIARKVIGRIALDVLGVS